MAPLPTIPYNTRSVDQSSSNEEGPIQSPDSLTTPSNPTLQEAATPTSPTTFDLVQLRMLEILERLCANATPISTNFQAPESKHLAEESDTFSGNKCAQKLHNVLCFIHGLLPR
ncbi:hypothetical protein C356_01545 [Cryptococcus neoformans c45]|nr:hypothetical protein C356_01545 [Cryptococcus neoformans var. grubii c45]